MSRQFHTFPEQNQTQTVPFLSALSRPIPSSLFRPVTVQSQPSRPVPSHSVSPVLTRPIMPHSGPPYRVPTSLSHSVPFRSTQSRAVAPRPVLSSSGHPVPSQSRQCLVTSHYVQFFPCLIALSRILSFRPVCPVQSVPLLSVMSPSRPVPLARRQK